MAKKLFIPDEDDARILREIISREKRRKSADPQRTDPEKMFNEEQEQDRAGIYIAIPGEGFEDVPAMEDDDSYGIGAVKSGLCDVLFIEEQTGLVKQAGFQERVYNIGRNALPLEPFHIVLDRFGFWSAVQGGGASGIWAVVTSKSTIAFHDTLTGTTVSARGRYRCDEVEWTEDGLWEKKIGGRTFTRCFESSMQSNANIHLTGKNIVMLWKPGVAVPSSSSESSVSGGSAGSDEGSGSSSSSSSANVDDTLYLFDKGLGGIVDPVRI